MTKLPSQIQKSSGISNGLRTGTVDSVSNAGVMVNINGAVVGPFGYLDSSTFEVGDTVAVFRQDSTWLVLGRATLFRGQWFTTSPINNFTISGGIPISFRLLADGNVQLYARVTSGATVGSGTPFAILPAGFRPVTNNITQICGNISSGVVLWTELATNGELQTHGTWVNGNVLLINAVFPIALG